MSFYERYASACQRNKIDPCGAEIAKILEINKSTASSWNQNKSTPHGAIIRRIANYFHVSADYLLERTDDPTDPQDAPLSVTFAQQQLISAFDMLDEVDQNEVRRFIDFKLTDPKYKKTGETA